MSANLWTSTSQHLCPVGQCIQYVVAILCGFDIVFILSTTFIVFSYFSILFLMHSSGADSHFLPGDAETYRLLTETLLRTWKGTVRLQKALSLGYAFFFQLPVIWTNLTVWKRLLCQHKDFGQLHPVFSQYLLFAITFSISCLHCMCCSFPSCKSITWLC